MTWRFRLRRHLVFLRHLIWEAYRERALVAIVATAVFASLIYILNIVYYRSGIWDKYYTLGDISTFFCELTDMNRMIRQPINTFTNFIYFVAAIFCFSKGMEDIRKNRAYNLITANRFYSFTLAAILMYTFVSSTLFHSSLIEFFSKMDFSAVYSITLFPAMYVTHRVILTVNGKPTNTRRPKERVALIIIFGVLYSVLTFNLDMEIVHPAVAGIIAVIIVGTIYLEYKDPQATKKEYLMTTVVSIAIAGILFELDLKKVFCNEMGRVSPHSLWHIFNGLAIFFFYLYIRSERYDETHDKLRRDLRQRVELKIRKSV